MLYKFILCGVYKYLFEIIQISFYTHILHFIYIFANLSKFIANKKLLMNIDT